MQPPFKEGELVRIKDNDHLGIHRVEECNWIERREGGGHWRCECSEQREVNWDNVLPGQCGIVMPGWWCGPPESLERITP